MKHLLFFQSNILRRAKKNYTLLTYYSFTFFCLIDKRTNTCRIHSDNSAGLITLLIKLIMLSNKKKNT